MVGILCRFQGILRNDNLRCDFLHRGICFEAGGAEAAALRGIVFVSRHHSVYLRKLLFGVQL